MIEIAAQVKKEKALQRAIYFLLTAITLISLFPVSVFAMGLDSISEDLPVYIPELEESKKDIPPTNDENVKPSPDTEQTDAYHQGIALFGNPCCANVSVVAIGHMGDIAAANSPTGMVIAGAPWEFCANCLTVTIGGGAIQMPDNTNTLNQSRFPVDIRPDIEFIVFTEPVIAGTSLHDLFNGLTNLTAIENIDYIDTALTRNMRRVFFDTHSLAGPLDLSGWDTSSATNMYSMFRNSGIDELNLGGSFNTGGFVTNMGSMFWGTSNLTTIGDVSNWNTSSVTRMSRMFQSASNLTGALDLNSWDTSSVTFMYSMFHGASSIPSLGDISGWDVHIVARMDNMFNDTSFTNLDLSGWNTVSVARTDNMFDGASSLVSLDLSGANMTNVSNRNHMFRGMSSLRRLTLGPDWHWTVFNLTGLPNVPNNTTYTGHWRNVGSGTITNPLGAYTPASAQLMDNSLGPNIANTWVWEPRVPQLVVTFNLNGGICNGSSAAITYTFPYGSLIGINNVPQPTHTDYSLEGWRENGVSPILDHNQVAGLALYTDRTFVAQWQIVDNGAGGGRAPIDRSPIVGATIERNPSPWLFSAGGSSIGGMSDAGNSNSQFNPETGSSMQSTFYDNAFKKLSVFWTVPAFLRE